MNHSDWLELVTLLASSNKRSLFQYSLIALHLYLFMTLTPAGGPLMLMDPIQGVNIVMVFFFNFLFHNSHEKFDRQTIVSNQINHTESWRMCRCCAWVRKRVCRHQGLKSWPRAWQCSEPSVIPLSYSHVYIRLLCPFGAIEPRRKGIGSASIKSCSCQLLTFTSKICSHFVTGKEEEACSNYF